MNPLLRVEKRFQGVHRRNWPAWHSMHEVSEQMEGESNLASWLFQMHAFLPAFPQRQVKIGDLEVTPMMWGRNESPPEHLDRMALIQHVWSLLNSEA